MILFVVGIVGRLCAFETIRRRESADRRPEVHLHSTSAVSSSRTRQRSVPCFPALLPILYAAATVRCAGVQERPAEHARPDGPRHRTDSSLHAAMSPREMNPDQLLVAHDPKRVHRPRIHTQNVHACATPGHPDGMEWVVFGVVPCRRLHNGGGGGTVVVVPLVALVPEPKTDRSVGPEPQIVAGVKPRSDRAGRLIEESRRRRGGHWRRRGLLGGALGGAHRGGYRHAVAVRAAGQADCAGASDGMLVTGRRSEVVGSRDAPDGAAKPKEPTLGYRQSSSSTISKVTDTSVPTVMESTRTRQTTPPIALLTSPSRSYRRSA